MKVCVQYTAQMRAIAGADQEHIELPPDGRLSTLVERLADEWGREGAHHMLDPDGQILRSLLIVVNDVAVPAGQIGTWSLHENDVVTFYPPIAGG